MSDFLLGLFTRHVRTKVLALLLAIGLFSFVQITQSTTRTIPYMVLQFRLDSDLAKTYSLIKGKVELKDVEVQGLRAIVDPLVKEWASKPEKELIITRSFLGRHADDSELRIPIDRDFFKDDALFGKDVEATKLPDGQAAVLDVLETRRLRVEVDPALVLKLPPESPYQGTGTDDRLQLETVKDVSVTGPKSAFAENARVIYTIDTLVQQIAAFKTQLDQAPVTLGNVRILWSEGGINVEYLDVRIEGKTPAEFKRGLVVTCQVVKRKETKPFATFPIVVRSSREFNLADWTPQTSSFGVVVSSRVLEEGSVENLVLRMPKALAEKKALTDNLVLEVNLTAARKEEGTNRLIVPVFLSLKDMTKEQDRDDLRLIEIDTPKREWYITFAPK